VTDDKRDGVGMCDVCAQVDTCHYNNQPRVSDVDALTAEIRIRFLDVAIIRITGIHA